MKRINKFTVTAATFLVTLAWSMFASAQDNAVQVDTDDIGGVVTCANGVESAVWVIAETEDFDTFFPRIVVTDDEGR